MGAFSESASVGMDGSEIRPYRKRPLVRPIIGCGYEALTYWVVANVGPLFSQTVVVSKSVVEEITLPNDAKLACKKAFPVLYGAPVCGLLSATVRKPTKPAGLKSNFPGNSTDHRSGIGLLVVDANLE